MQTFEIITALALLGLAVWLFIGSIRSKKEGKCDSCAAKCPSRELGGGCGDIAFIARNPKESRSGKK